MSTWLLIRGLTRGSAHWSVFPDVLADRLNATVLPVDVPGNGPLNKLASPTRIEAMTDRCREQARSLGVDPPYRLLAVSMGAMVAIDWATRFPAELEACVVVNTSLRSLSPWHMRLRPAHLMALTRVAFAPMSASRKEAIVLRLTSRRPGASASVLGEWITLRKTQPVSRINALRQLVAAARYRPPPEFSSVPLLVLASRRDSLVDVRCSTTIARHWRSAFEVHSSAGHDLTLDDGPWVAERISEWLFRETLRESRSRR